MKRVDIFGLLVIVLIVIISVKKILESDMVNLKCVIANKDGNTYCVRKRDDIPKAADLLAEVSERMKLLVKHLHRKYPDKPQVVKIVESFDSIKLIETLPTSEHTAYSENKGEKIALCLNKKHKENDTKLIDKNTLTFVALHELSHVGTESIGHEPEFWNNFKFILNEAKNIGIYKPIDYKNNPMDYCGDKLTDNPYFDL